MTIPLISLLSMLVVTGEKIGPASRTLLQIGDLHRSYVVHVPPHYDPKSPIPVVLACTGGHQRRMMANYSGLAKKRRAGFAVVYANAPGRWNHAHLELR